MESRTFAALLLMVFTLGASLAHAQQEDGREIRISDGVGQYLRLVDFSIESGRIVAISQHAGRTVTSSTSGPGAHRREQLRVSIDPAGRAQIRYENIDPQDDFLFEVGGAERLEIRRIPKGDSKVGRLEFLQVPRKELELIVNTQDGTRKITGKSLWHLLLSEPELCRNKLIPLLEVVKPDWNLVEKMILIEDALVRWARRHKPIASGEIVSLVEQLGSPTFARRRAAEQALIELGDQATPSLMAIDLSQLDAEQRFRVRRLIDRADAKGSDTPHRVAAQLSRDPQVWLAMLSRSDPARRKLAVEQLETLLAQPIRFEAEADDATRAEQIQSIRQILDQPAAP